MYLPTGRRILRLKGGGGIRMGNTCVSMADPCLCMTKKKKKRLKGPINSCTGVRSAFSPIYILMKFLLPSSFFLFFQLKYNRLKILVSDWVGQKVHSASAYRTNFLASPVQNKMITMVSVVTICHYSGLL